MQKSRRIKQILRTAFLLGAAFCYSAAAYAAIDANTLPTGGQIAAGNGVINSSGNIMNITGLDDTVIKWDSFDIGSSATVNFSDGTGYERMFNVLNYVASGGSMSQIYGTMNAQGGNVYLVNPAGVFIGDGANVNVGILYVSNKKNDALDEWQSGQTLNKSFDELMQSASTPQTAAELMSLGNITANSVIFEGDRIVLDMDKLKNRASAGTPDLEFHTDNTDNMVLGYTAYTDNSKTYADKAQKFTVITVNSKNNVELEASIDGYMWVEDGEQLQALNTNLSGNYALRNDIDLAASNINNFMPIGDPSNKFTGKLDGLRHSISNLYINSSNNYVGLFGVTHGATLRNLELASGSVISSGSYSTGGLVGDVCRGVIENIINSGVNVSGKSATGGIIGENSNAGSEGATLRGMLLNNAIVQATNSSVGGVIGYNSASVSGVTLINSGVVVGEGNVPAGGVIGYNGRTISGSSLVGTADSVVISEFQVGGLIGLNYGNVKGGREGNYYAYQIYNDGLVIGGSYKQSLAASGDANAWTSIAGGRGYYQVSEDSRRIGGLIGTNYASLSAAYNTGSVQGRESVGGIVGYNSQNGSIDQVFNIGSVQGSSYVGGIVGQIYKSSGSNFYFLNNPGLDYKGGGEGGNYKADTSDSNVWQDYGSGTKEYGTNKLLAVFLTNVEFVPYEGFEDERFVYDASERGYSVGTDGQVYRKDGTAIGYLQDVDANAPHFLQSYLDNNSNIGELLAGSSAKDSGTYNIITSKQIDSKGHLGFKIVSDYDGSTPTFSIDRKELTVRLNDVTHTYGSADGKYDFTVEGWAYDEGKQLAKNLQLQNVSDGALTGATSGRVTKDANSGGESYTWSGTVSGFDSDALKNYTVDGVDKNGMVSLTNGKSVVTHVDLVVNIGDVEMTYGDSEDLYKDKYSFAASEAEGKSLVNGDELADVIAGMAYKNTGFTQDGRTKDAGGDYSVRMEENNIVWGNSVNNYRSITFNAGKVTINPKELTVSLNDVSRVYGDKNLSAGSEYGFAVEGWVYDEGKQLAKNLQLQSVSDGALTGELSGRVTNDANKSGESYIWSGEVSGLNSDALKNYTIAGADDATGTAIVTGGKSVVTQADLTVNIGDVKMTYGDEEEDITYSYAASKTDGEKLVNGDELADVIASMTYANTGFQNGKTQDAGGGYSVSQDAVTPGAAYDNYRISFTAGDVEIAQRKLSVSLNDVSRVYGDSALSTNSAYGFAVDGWAYDEGDELKEKLQLQNVSDGALTGESSGRVTNDANKSGESYTWSGEVSGLNSDALKNYTVDGVDDATGTAIVTGGKSVVTQADLTINIGDVKMTYGDEEKDITYSYAASKTDGEKLVNGDELADVIASMTYANSGFKENGKTRDVGSNYELQGAVSEQGASYGNYKIKLNAGNVTINPKELTVSLNEVSRVYGDKNLSAGSEYGFVIEGWAYDEDYKDALAVEVTQDTALKNISGAPDADGRVTNNVGDSYTWSGEVSVTDTAKLKNYTLANADGTGQVALQGGKASVKKARLEITTDSPAAIVAGNVAPDFTGTDIRAALVNGDTLAEAGFAGYYYGVSGDADLSQVGEYTVGIYLGGQYYDLSDSLNALASLSGNYEYELTPGSLTVKEQGRSEEASLWQAEDKYPWYQWDKRRTAREREAEIQIVDGGMQFD